VYPLINYSGTLSGGLNNFIVSGLTGIPYTLTNPPGQIALVVKSYRTSAAVTWTGGSGGNAWDLLVTSNWLNGATKDLFAPNDTVRFDDTGAANPVVNLAGDLNPASLVVDTASNYTFTGVGDIFGPCSLTKTNSGTLTISTVNNTFTGTTTIAGGTLAVSELDALGFPSPLGNPPGGSTNLILSGSSTLRITGESYTERGMTLNAGTNTIEVVNASDQVTIAGQIVGGGALVKAGAGALAFSGSNGYTGGTFIYGGSVALGSAAGNQYGLGGGLVTLSNATLSLMDIEASENCAWKICVLTNSASTLNCDGRSTMSGSLTGGGTLNVYSPYVRTDFSGNWSAFTGQINATGGNFRENNSAGYPLAKLNVGSAASLQNRVGGTPTISIGELSGAQGGNCSASGGNDGVAVNWSVGGLNTSATFACNTYNNVGFIKVGTGTWTWTGTNTAHTGQTTLSGGTLQIGSGGTTGMLGTGNVTDNATLAFNRSDFITDTNYGIIGGTGNLAKRGAGRLALTRAHTYAGATTVEAGVLALTNSGSIANSSNIIVSAGALFDVSGRIGDYLLLAGGKMISGNGSVNGDFVVGSGARLAPGMNGIGTLTFSNSLTLAGTSTSIFEISKSPLTNDVVKIFGALTNGGTLIVTNIGVAALTGGDSFRLFNAASYTGAFASVVLPPLPTGLGWNTGALNTNGTLSVIVTARPFLGMGSAGNGFMFSGTGGVANANFYLLASTNIATPLSGWMRLLTNQFDNDGNFNFTSAAGTNAQSFYRLLVP
jgi:autotransporter-associated beta strand protein